MGQLEGKIAWVTGGGSGIGESGAKALAQAGATVILSGRRKEPLDKVAAAIGGAGGKAHVEPADVTDKARVTEVARAIEERFGRLDILVNNAGLNVPNRSWANLTPDSVDTVIEANLSGPFYIVASVLPLMRAQKDGVMIHTSSWAGRFVSPLSGAAYSASKHAVVAMSHSINMEEFANGIRSSVICPAEVATPILDKRPIKVSQEDRDRMLQADDLGELILFVATRPKHVCMNEVLISPTWNRGYIRPTVL